MDIYPIPFEFIESKLTLNWCDMKWGYEKNIITPDAPIQKAERTVLAGCYNDTELEMSFLYPDDTQELISLLGHLCGTSGQDDDSVSKGKWLFITLSWLWVNRSKFADPLAEVEAVYADFDYPKEMDGFIRYMPPVDGYDPSIHTDEENYKNLMSKWEWFLENDFYATNTKQ